MTKINVCLHIGFQLMVVLDPSVAPHQCDIYLSASSGKKTPGVNMDPSGQTIPNKFLSPPTAQYRAGFEPSGKWLIAEQKSPVLTAQTTQPA